jgi:hypothetical protein
MVFRCSVTEVQKGAFLVKLSCRGSYLRGEKHFQKQTFGPYYQEDQKVLEAMEKAKKK